MFSNKYFRTNVSKSHTRKKLKIRKDFLTISNLYEELSVPQWQNIYKDFLTISSLCVAKCVDTTDAY